jgi:hypothetical protein
MKDFFDTYKNKLILLTTAAIMMTFFDTYSSSPIVFILDFIICLEFSKLLYLMLSDSSTPIFLRYILASVIVSLVKYFYMAMQVFDKEKMITYSVFIAVFIALRWIAIMSTQKDDNRKIKK